MALTAEGAANADSIATQTSQMSQARQMLRAAIAAAPGDFSGLYVRPDRPDKPFHGMVDFTAAPAFSKLCPACETTIQHDLPDGSFAEHWFAAIGFRMAGVRRLDVPEFVMKELSGEIPPNYKLKGFVRLGADDSDDLEMIWAAPNGLSITVDSVVDDFNHVRRLNFRIVHSAVCSVKVGCDDFALWSKTFYGDTRAGSSIEGPLLGRLEFDLLTDDKNAIAELPLHDLRDQPVAGGIERHITLPGDVEGVAAGADAGSGSPLLNIFLKADAQKRIGDVKLVDRKIALTIDGKTLISDATVREPLGTEIQLTGKFTTAGIAGLVNAINPKPPESGSGMANAAYTWFAVAAGAVAALFVAFLALRSRRKKQTQNVGTSDPIAK
jgi:hypothetical protein